MSGERQARQPAMGAIATTGKTPGRPVFCDERRCRTIYPEDYNEAGSMWDHLERHKVDFYNLDLA